MARRRVRNRWWGRPRRLLWRFLVSGIVAFVAWWWVRHRGEHSSEETESSIRIGGQETPGEPMIHGMADVQDDLQQIEGIGPKVNALLRDAGITTFESLATTDVDQLKSVLRRADLAMIDPSGWPAKARLAAGEAAVDTEPA
ncbi:MAG: helix-hairpin-helix domain-containing protein [Chloroflexi bacterium]|nr:helix-hairpin-helix domain-containing protein [Chloroflexota bacterium]